ncbi:MAG: DUF2207 domain-containing protein [Atopobiaceae bacterium]|nr:DUF2207 domain-containing protein [Atopobiaceae bacterium]
MFYQIRMRRVPFGVFACIVALFVALALPARVALAWDYSIDSVDIDATVQTDGTLSVQESRLFDFDGSYHGVYWNLPSGTYNGREIETRVEWVGEQIDGEFVQFEQSNSGEDHTYLLEDYDGGTRVKVYSAHEDERATFVILYSNTNLAVRHADVSELYWKFVSDGWDVESENVTCTVHLPVPEGRQVEPEESVRAWGHGPLDAEVRFDGNDIVYEVPGVGTSEFAEARITFPTDWLSDATPQGDRVLQDILAEEQQWADEANARRERARVFMYGGAGVGLVGAIVSLLMSIVAYLRYRAINRPQFDDKYFRDVPSKDHPAVLGALLRGGEPGGEDFTATLMRLSDMGMIDLESVKSEDKGLFGMKKSHDDYRLTLTRKAGETQLDPIDRRALTTLFENIGKFAPSQRGTEGVGTSVCFSDLEKVAKNHPSSYESAFENWESKVGEEIARRRFFFSDRKTGRGTALAAVVLAGLLIFASIAMIMFTEAWQIFLPLILVEGIALAVGVVCAVKMEDYSEEAIELKAKLEALRRWLKDFTRLEEAVPRDVVLWDNLLVMAVVLGVADEVIKQLKMVAPEILEDPRLATTYGWYGMGRGGYPYDRFNESYSSAHHVSSEKLASSSSSSGGGGGGGFSSGGGGGFGGGGGGGAF